jgi:tRNA U34 5-methylaminomethyl-2-thiouridine-forming methyltransferase MnmC
MDDLELEEGQAGLAIRRGADGSFSLWSEAFREGFHSGRGALREARETFLRPSQLERFPPGTRLRVVEVCVGTGSNLALLLEACAAGGLRLEWWGLELDPRPLRLALASGTFRRPWQPHTLTALERLGTGGLWQGELAHCRLLWGDARQTLLEVRREWRGEVDLIWHDAFSPRRCPQLWTVEVLAAAAGLLAPEGRWISYSSAAAVRESLRQLGLHLVALPIPETAQGLMPEPSPGSLAEGASGSGAGSGVASGLASGTGSPGRLMIWSGGTVASPKALTAGLPEAGASGVGPFGGGPPGADPLGAGPLGAGALWRDLTEMERDHLASAAGEPYRDPSGSADAATILASRVAAQATALANGTRFPSTVWRRRWGVERGGRDGCRQGEVTPLEATEA